MLKQIVFNMETDNFSKDQGDISQKERFRMKTT